MVEFNTDEKFTLTDVINAYMKCRQNKRKTYNALEFEQNWMENCAKLHKELSDGTYEIGKSIAFAVIRPKLREVFAADFRDRIVHHLVIGELEKLFEDYFIDDCYNCRRRKGTYYGVCRLHEKIEQCSDNYTKTCYVFKGDMKGFFMSIHKPTLWKMLEIFIKETYKGRHMEQVLWLTKMIVLHSPEKNCIVKGDYKILKSLPSDKSLFTCGDDYGLPIGNLSSQMFANFYLSPFDHMMSKKFKYYGRYVDDFYIIDEDKEKILSFLPTIREYLSKFHVTLHPSKVYLQHYTKGVKFVGSVSKMNRRYIGNRTVSNMISAIEEMNKVNDKESYSKRFVSRINSYLGFMYHYSNYGLRRKLLNMIDKEWWKYCYSDNKFRKVVLARPDKKKYELIDELNLQNN